MGNTCVSVTQAGDSSEFLPALAGSPSLGGGGLENYAGLTNHAEIPTCRMGCGFRVQPGLHKGRQFDTCCRGCALSPGAGVHDVGCPGPPGARGAGAARRPRPVCAKGARCRGRTPEHLAAEAHPLDRDYRASCAAAGAEPEEPSLRLLFDWADADGSGKLSKEELSATLHIISALSGDSDPEDALEISAEAWKRLDEDGNGLVNFNEFACWAGPRLGLPLGVKRMALRPSSGVQPRPCSVYNCPCESFESGLLHLHCKRCKHKSSSHVSREQKGEIPYPDYWENSGDSPHALVSLNGTAGSEFQRLLDETYSKAWTRDRSRHNANKKVPRGFKVVALYRNENCDNWKEYCLRRAELLAKVHEDAKEGRERIEVITDVKTTVAWRSFARDKTDRLAPECNEWYLFHGTNPKAAQTICGTDFKLSFAGDNTGTLYGRGLYFAESITKSDEYAKPNADGTYAVLLCRILGGRVKYTAAATPDVEELVHSVTEGPYDTILGDREKCRGTYREFVIFDTEDVYPEYLIEYQRLY